MTIKVQIQTPGQETSYLLIARSWESPEGKDHLIYPARCNFLGRYLLVPGRAEVTAQKGIYSDVENQVTIFYPLMSIGFASPRLRKTRVEFVCEINTRAAGCTGFCGDIYSWKQQNHQWVAFKKKKKSSWVHVWMWEHGWILGYEGLQAGYHSAGGGCPHPQGAPTEPGLDFQCDSTC